MPDDPAPAAEAAEAVADEVEVGVRRASAGRLRVELDTDGSGEDGCCCWPPPPWLLTDPPPFRFDRLVFLLEEDEPEKLFFGEDGRANTDLEMWW